MQRSTCPRHDLPPEARWKVDENMSGAAITSFLQQANSSFNAESVADENLTGQVDSMIWDATRREKRIIITRNGDLAVAKKSLNPHFQQGEFDKDELPTGAVSLSPSISRLGDLTLLPLEGQLRQESLKVAIAAFSPRERYRVACQTVCIIL